MEHLKTNSKEFKTRLHNYILESIDGESYGKELKTVQEKLQFVNDCFIKEFWFDNNQRYYRNNKVTGFANYLMGLPSIINIAFENYKILELAKTLGSYKDTTGMTFKAIERYEDKIINNWFILVADNFFKMLETN